MRHRTYPRKIRCFWSWDSKASSNVFSAMQWAAAAGGKTGSDWAFFSLFSGASLDSSITTAASAHFSTCFCFRKILDSLSAHFLRKACSSVSSSRTVRDNCPNLCCFTASCSFAEMINFGSKQRIDYFAINMQLLRQIFFGHQKLVDRVAQIQSPFY